MAGEDPVDVLPKLTEECKPKCVGPFKKYQDCGDRIAKTKEGDCEAWFFDYMKCIDQCRVPQLKAYIK